MSGYGWVLIQILLPVHISLVLVTFTHLCMLHVCLLTTVCVKLLGLYLPVYTFCCMRASVSGLMALLVMWIFH